MTAHRSPDAEIQPIKVRVRQVFSGNGETSSVESVHCPALARSLPVAACNVCGHKQGNLVLHGETSVLCDDAGACEAELKELMHARAVVPDTTPVSELMTTDVLCVRPDVSIDALVGFLLERNISGVPVVDERGAPIGIVSKTDLIRHRFDAGDTSNDEAQLERGFHTMELVEGTVAEVMTKVPITFSESTPISQVAATMAYEGVHRLPIVARDGSVVGIVSSLDIVAWYAKREGYVAGVRRA